MAASDPRPAERLAATDIAAGLALSDAAGWNQTADDWAVFMGRGRVFGRRSDAGDWVATGAALPYADDQGWISMVLTAGEWRHRGFATALLAETIAYLRDCSLTPVLDATPAGEPVYRRLGFAPGLGFERWESDARPTPRPGATPAPGHASPRPVGVDALARIAALDAQSCRIDRHFLIADLLGRPDTRAWLSADDRGYVIARAGRRATQVGPLVAADATAAGQLLDAVLAGRDTRVFIDAVGGSAPSAATSRFAAQLVQRGFRRQRPFLRMALGEARAASADDRMFAVAGPEFG